MEKKKKIKIWGKIKLYETSAVGIAAYPDAHLSADSFSLIKALSESGDQLNLEIDDIMEKDENVQDESEEEVKAREEAEAKAKEEADAKAKEEADKAEAEAKAKEEAEKSKPLTIDDLQKVVDGAMEKAMKGSETERGLVLTEDEALKELKDKSIGELAMMGGLFKPN